MSFLRASRFLFPLSLALAGGSLILLVFPGPRLSVEFTGGTLMELRLPQDVTKDDLTAALHALPEAHTFGNIAMTAARGGSFFLRSRNLTNEEHRLLLGGLENTFTTLEELQFTTIGPTVGKSLRVRALWALALAAVAIILYLAFAFRKIPKQFSPWLFGISAIIAVLHDTLITIGIFTILSVATTFEVDLLFVSALLSIMGYSVNDTIVIFDRIRDNLFLSGTREDFPLIAEQSLRQSLTRTINTGTGALIMLTALLLFGAESIRWFMLALIVGTVVGTYSSFFVATPLLVYWRKGKTT